jgi:hypothetical protein
MKRPHLLCVLAIALALTIHTFGQDTKPSDKETLVKASKILEQAPFHEKAKDFRAWAVNYVIQTDEVSVVVCGGDIMAPLLDKKNKFSSELIAQYTIGMAAYKISNPASASDENAAQLAGIESALRAYQSMVKEKPKAQYAPMDDLAAKDTSGELKKMVDAANCGKKSSDK